MGGVLLGRRRFAVARGSKGEVMNCLGEGAIMALREQQIQPESLAVPVV